MQRHATGENSSNSSSTEPEPEAARSRTAPVHLRANIQDLVALKASWTIRTELNSISTSSNRTQQSAFASLCRESACGRGYEAFLEHYGVEVKGAGQNWGQENDTSWLYPLPSDYLISLVYYNVYRALIFNIGLLGLDFNLMYSDDYPSPFLPLSQSANSKICRLPPALQPTELQKTIAHHPAWDIIPDPDVRDNILRYGEDNLDDRELCNDMVGDGSHGDSGDVDTQNKNGIIIWGEPWDIGGWEVTVAFARKWPILLRNAPRIQASTNKWRIRRGEDPLDFDGIWGVYE